jgi:hypothetical protein
MSESEVNAVLTSPGSVTLLPNDEQVNISRQARETDTDCDRLQAAVIELYNDSINYVWIVCIFFCTSYRKESPMETKLVFLYSSL